MLVAEARLPGPTWSDMARSQEDSVNPDTWRGLFGGWVPPLGRTGLVLYDITGKNDGTFERTTIPIWGLSPYQSSSEALIWNATTTKSGINLGDILDFRFLQLERWSFIISCSFTDMADERRILNKWNASATRQITFRANLATPAKMQLYINGTLRCESPTAFITADTWYTFAVCNDGTGGAGGLIMRTFGEKGQLLETVTGQHTGNKSDLTLPITLWGTAAGNFDPFYGTGGVAYFYKRTLPLPTIRTIARDNLAPLRPIRRKHWLPTAAPAGGNSPTGTIYGPLYGPLAGVA